jgi:hypothetical protein
MAGINRICRCVEDAQKSENKLTHWKSTLKGGCSIKLVHLYHIEISSKDIVEHLDQALVNILRRHSRVWH